MMNPIATFAAVLEAVDQLSAEEQATLISIVRRRSIERDRQRIAAEAREAQAEFEAGHGTPATPGDLMDEILA